MFNTICLDFSKIGRGTMCVWNSSTLEILQSMSLPGNTSVKSLNFSRDGLYLLVCGSDRFVRLLDFLTTENSVSLTYRRDFQDVVNRQVWKCGCLSGNSDYLAAAVNAKDQHKIYIWNSFGQLVTILEGPKEGIEQIYWHPYLPNIIVLTNLGKVRLWLKSMSENWSAFAPNFEVLEENVVYEEREDEFDLKPEDNSTTQGKHLEVIDIISKIPQLIFSSDSEDEDLMKYLPAIPIPDSEKPPPVKLVNKSDQPQFGLRVVDTFGLPASSNKRRSRSRTSAEFSALDITSRGKRVKKGGKA